MLFGENLKRICEAKGTTPTQMCKDLGWSTSKVSDWYNKGTIPNQPNILKIAQFLGCSVMDFFEDEEQLAARKPPIVLDEDETEMLRIFRTLDRRTKHEFMACVYRFEKESTLQGNDEEMGRTPHSSQVG